MFFTRRSMRRMLGRMKSTEKYELFRKRYFERAYPKAMKALAQNISTPEFREFYERPETNRFAGWRITMLGFEYNKDISLDLKQTETGETVGMAFADVTSCDIRLNDADFSVSIRRRRDCGTSVSNARPQRKCTSRSAATMEAASSSISDFCFHPSVKD